MLSSLLADTAVYYEGWETVCPVSAPFFGFMGIASAVIFANLVRIFFSRVKVESKTLTYVIINNREVHMEPQRVELVLLQWCVFFLNMRNGRASLIFFSS